MSDPNESAGTDPFPGADWPEPDPNGPTPAGPSDNAPWGINPKTGRPYTKSPEERAELGARLTAARLAAQSERAGPGAPRSRRRGGAKQPGPAGSLRVVPAGMPDYRPGVMGLLQIPTVALAMLGRVNPVYALDAATLQLHAAPIAQAVHDTATADDRVAAILDKVLAAGPYGALLGALIPVALQIAANHGAIPVEPSMGILSGDQLVAALNGQDLANAA